MSAYVLLKLLTELRKNKMQDLPSILSLLPNEFKKTQLYKSTNVRFYLSYDI